MLFRSRHAGRAGDFESGGFGNRNVHDWVHDYAGELHCRNGGWNRVRFLVGFHSGYRGNESWNRHDVFDFGGSRRHWLVADGFVLPADVEKTGAENRRYDEIEKDSLERKLQAFFVAKKKPDPAGLLVS